MINEKPQSIWSQVDWLTIGLYIALMLFGWLSICGASYTFGDNDLLSLGTRSGMQIVWIGTSICLGFVILMMDSRFFDTFSFVIYGVLLLLLSPPSSTLTTSRVRTRGSSSDRSVCSLPSSASSLRRWLSPN